MHRNGANESTASRVCNKRDCDSTRCSPLGGARQTSNTLDNRRRGTVGARKRPKETAGCRLRCESDEEDDTVADECDEDTAHIFLRRTRRSCNSRMQRARRRDTSSKKEQREQISVLSCNMRAIRTRDYTLTLATRVRNGEKEREIVVEERRRDEWRTESDVVVRETRRGRTL